VTDYDQLICSLDEFGLGSWRVSLEPLIRSRFGDRAHGDIGKWRAVIDQLPNIAGASARLDASAVAVAGSPVNPQIRHDLRELLLQLRPWRKGPFNIHGIDIDTEWRSDLKWDRIRHAITPLTDRRILDVGCGNGYFSLRMLGDGAKFVVGIDPTLLKHRTKIILKILRITLPLVV
jgi:tRNA (mo5U34)-methyltransferase